MPKILLESGSIFNFCGDALICFCDTDLSYKRNNLILQKTYNENLAKELAAIGYCEIGNAVITKSYIPKIKNYIFVPYTDHEDSENRLNYILFHKALRSAFSLAYLYRIKKLAIPLLRTKNQQNDFMQKAIVDILNMGQQELLNEKEIEDITIAIIKELEKQTIDEVFVYR